MKRAGKEITPSLCIILDGRVHMAELATYATHAINGVAALHSEILKNDVFADWYQLYPERFQNKTNGITQRRWLGLCNPELTKLITDQIGPGFETDLDRLKELVPKINKSLCSKFRTVKKAKKKQLCAEILKKEGVVLDPDMIFDVQVKRLHEYKRQFMNALSILAIYDQLKRGQLKDFPPVAFVFGAKAAPGYARAKAIIYFINSIAAVVNRDPATRDLLRVVFVHNYDCSYAEKIIPAAEISEQISPAGTEASGTSNMKLMMNGAVTLGTMDGANIEIVEKAGLGNNYIFGATVGEINRVRADYDPNILYKSDARLARAMDWLINGRVADKNGMLKELHDSLLKGASWHRPDHYFVCLDFEPYLEAKLQANRDYRDPAAFARKCLLNAANAGSFSSDRTIGEYAREIWRTV